MDKTLQQLFIDSQGKPVEIDGVVIKQSDLIPIFKGKVTIRFIGGSDGNCGIRLKAKQGKIALTNGSSADIVDTWQSKELPPEITYLVHCPEGQLRLWNIYRTAHPNGLTTEDMWTGNAGMVLLSERPNVRRYGCSHGGIGRFNPKSLIVEVQWDDSGLNS
jgi:hypothetical protein